MLAEKMVVRTVRIVRTEGLWTKIGQGFIRLYAGPTQKGLKLRGKMGFTDGDMVQWSHPFQYCMDNAHRTTGSLRQGRRQTTQTMTYFYKPGVTCANCGGEGKV